MLLLLDKRCAVEWYWRQNVNSVGADRCSRTLDFGAASTLPLIEPSVLTSARSYSNLAFVKFRSETIICHPSRNTHSTHNEGINLDTLLEMYGGLCGRLSYLLPEEGATAETWRTQLFPKSHSEPIGHYAIKYWVNCRIKVVEATCTNQQNREVYTVLLFKIQ